MDSDELKVGEMVDCRSMEHGWIGGKILDKDIMPFTYKQRVKVLHKINKAESFQTTYEFQRGLLQYFPSLSYQYGEQNHLRLVQRVFNEANNRMKLCNIPLLVCLTSWMRWREFNYLVFLQVKRFISQGYKFNKTGHAQETNKANLSRFKEYLQGKNFPYTLNLVDYRGHCAICYKFVKTIIQKRESESYCEGCKVNAKEPICWQLRVTDLMIAVDWVSS